MIYLWVLHMGILLLGREREWEPSLFMGICSLTASKRWLVERDSVRLPDLSQARHIPSGSVSPHSSFSYACCFNAFFFLVQSRQDVLSNRSGGTKIRLSVALLIQIWRRACGWISGRGSLRASHKTCTSIVNKKRGNVGKCNGNEHRFGEWRRYWKAPW